MRQPFRPVVQVVESAQPVEDPLPIPGRASVAESRPLAEAEASATAGGRLEVQLITPGWGSSGYYSQQVLEAAGIARVFPAGTHMYLDHPGVAEQHDRPVRSVRDLAAVLTEDATWNGSALVAPAQVFGPFADALVEMRDAIGVSIRADATVEIGEAEGRRGTIVTELVEATSVDFVTQAGRGGRILAVLESARPARVAERAVDHGVAEATANETQEALSNAVRERFASAEQEWAWVRDFDDATVWFQREAQDTTGTFQLAYTANEDGTVSLADGDPVEVTVRTQYVPVTPAGQSTTTQESEEDTMPQIEEARLRQLEADAGRVQTAEEARTAAEQRAEAAERRLRESDARNQARPIAAEVVTASESLPPSTRTRLVEAAVADVQIGEDGTFDQAAFRTAVEAARTQAETELAEALAAAGAGTPRGNGDRQAAVENRAASDAARARAFGRPVTQEG